MTKPLKMAFKEASELPEIEQKAFAKWIIGELEAEARWQVAFAASEDIIDKLADGALAEHKTGKSKILNVKDL